MASRLRTSIFGLAVALAVSTSRADVDIPSQLYNQNSIKGPDEPSDSIQKSLIDRFKLSNTMWADLPPKLQRALLWDAGLIRAGGGNRPSSSSSSSSSSSFSGAVVGSSENTYLQVYVPCGSTMNDAFVAYPTMVRQSNSMNCTLEACNINTHFTRSECLVDALENVTTCSVDQSALTSLAMYNYASWAQDGKIGEQYDPVIVRKRGTGRNASDPRKRGIPIDMFAIVEYPGLTYGAKDWCPSKTSFVLPCRPLNVSDRAGWCVPTQQLGMKLWIKEFIASSTPAPTPAPTESSSESSSWALNALAITFLVALAVAVVLGIALFVLTRKKHSADEDAEPFAAEPSSPAYRSGFNAPHQHSRGHRATHSGDLSSSTMSGSTAREIELANETYRQNSTVLAEFCADQALMIKRIAYSRIRLQEHIGKGANGEVWKAHHDGKDVAVKRVRLHGTNNDEIEIKTLEEFTREIRLASMLDHPNIVSFIGLSWRMLSELCMVSEYMPAGNLSKHLESNDGKQMKWGDEKLRIAVDVGSALVYLHSLLPQVIHRDLKSGNVLLDEHLTAKLSDFGLSRERSHEETMTSGVGTMLWTAPEVLRGERYDEKADIYSFGVLLVELDTCLPPFSLNTEIGKIRSKEMALLPLITRGTIRPKFSPQCPKPILELATQCLDLDPTTRPSAMQVVYHLRSKIRPLL